MHKLLQKIFEKRKLLSVAFICVVLLVSLPNIAFANRIVEGFARVLENFVGILVFMLTLILSVIGGVIISIESWFLGLILSINFNLVNAAPVRIGFPIVLSVANLFFVGALIAIAIATMIRREEYAAKNTLWKVVVMSIMVNFGLVICGALLSVSDQTAKFFLQSITPIGGNQGYFQFAHAIAGAFNPPAQFLNFKDLSRNPAAAKSTLSGFAKVGSSLGGILKPLVSVIFTLGGLIIIIITLGVMAAMLMWRYVRLGMALIILPIAWASWIFPTYQEHYKKWWTKFTQWAIFPPVMLFFLWLGLKVSEVMSHQTGEFELLYESQGGLRHISTFFGNAFIGIIAQTLKSFILFGIFISGMVAAQELGVKFADAGYKAIEGAGNGAKQWASRRIDKATARPREAAGRLKTRMGVRFTKVGARVAGLAERGGIPFMNKKKILNDEGKVVKVEKQPWEKLSGKLTKKAETARDRLEDRISPGGSLKQRKGENIYQWQKRLSERGFGPKVIPGTPEESENDWNERFKQETSKLVESNPELEKKDGESDDEWKDRIISAKPELKRREAKPGETESSQEWKRRLNEIIQRRVGEIGQRDSDKDASLLESIWSGATSGFKKGAGHKKLTSAQLKKVMEKEFGIHVDDHDDHSPAQHNDSNTSNAHH